MLRQYLEIKEQHPGTILFYRMGDFYEMFFEDAETASRVLGITLTSRNKGDENQVPMCGVPYHAVSGYLSKMVKAGYRVAICEQAEDPKEAKGIVKREVVRVVSPGVTTDDQLLDEKANTFVCALTAARKGQKLLTVGLSFLDVSTGNFLISEIPLQDANLDPVIDEITRSFGGGAARPRSGRRMQTATTRNAMGAGIRESSGRGFRCWSRDPGGASRVWAHYT
mgnify:CR=1 FL=1